jgi:hypothetical protein
LIRQNKFRNKKSEKQLSGKIMLKKRGASDNKKALCIKKQAHTQPLVNPLRKENVCKKAPDFSSL